MITIRRDAEIYEREGGWFQARWHFSFDEYFDPEWMSFGDLRVFNDDRLVPGAIWPMHPHRDIEGLTYVVEGSFRHADNLGNDGVLPAGSAQRMTLGAGAWHSEQNASETEPMRFIQMWIRPAERGLPPGRAEGVHGRGPHRPAAAHHRTGGRRGGPGPPGRQRVRVGAVGRAFRAPRVPRRYRRLPVRDLGRDLAGR